MSVLGTRFYPEEFSGQCVVCGMGKKQFLYATRVL